MNFLFFCFIAYPVCAYISSQLVFSDSQEIFGVLTSNDQHGKDFINYFNNTLDSRWNRISKDGIWGMSLLDSLEILEKPNFFVPDIGRKKAVRYLGYFQKSSGTQNLTIRLGLMSLFNVSNHAVKAEPQVLASRVFGQMFLFVFLPITSFIFHQFLQLIKDICVHPTVSEPISN